MSSNSISLKVSEVDSNVKIPRPYFAYAHVDVNSKFSGNLLCNTHTHFIFFSKQTADQLTSIGVLETMRTSHSAKDGTHFYLCMAVVDSRSQSFVFLDGRCDLRDRW